jgi:fructose-1,6-bisphosphatase/inositol monophosphatase family enzyme
VHNFERIETEVFKAGQTARRQQKEVVRSYKADGSVLTEVDLAIEKQLTSVIKTEFPDVNIVSEEFPTEFRSGREFTFTIDPIDGTDTFSQGMPGWCVAVGILDKELEPIGGIISAPRWGSDPDNGVFIRVLPGEPLRIDGLPTHSSADDHVDGSQLMVGSKVHRKYDFSTFPGKVRSIGSSILHIISPLIHPVVLGAFIPPAFIWDIAAAHGIIKSQSFILEYVNGTPVQYATMVHRQTAAHHMVCGTKSSIASIRKHLLLLKDRSAD